MAFCLTHFWWVVSVGHEQWHSQPAAKSYPDPATLLQRWCSPQLEPVDQSQLSAKQCTPCSAVPKCGVTEAPDSQANVAPRASHSHLGTISYTFIPKACMRVATSLPILPRPMIASVLPSTSFPINFLRSHLPALIEQVPSDMFLQKTNSAGDQSICNVDALFPLATFTVSLMTKGLECANFFWEIQYRNVIYSNASMHLKFTTNCHQRFDSFVSTWTLAQLFQTPVSPVAGVGPCDSRCWSMQATKLLYLYTPKVATSHQQEPKLQIIVNYPDWWWWTIDLEVCCMHLLHSLDII